MNHKPEHTHQALSWFFSQPFPLDYVNSKHVDINQKHPILYNLLIRNAVCVDLLF